MDIREYILSIAGAAIIGSCATILSGNQKIIKIICGIFVALSICQPIIRMNFDTNIPSIAVFSSTADQITFDACTSTARYQRGIIKDHIETYICNKASDLGCTVSASVTLSDKEPYQPLCISIKGEVSPYAKTVLSETLESELGVPSEAQKWNH